MTFSVAPARSSASGTETVRLENRHTRPAGNATRPLVPHYGLIGAAWALLIGCALALDAAGVHRGGKV